MSKSATHNNLFRNRPSHITSQDVWRKLVKAALTRPLTNGNWAKDDKGNWYIS